MALYASIDCGTQSTKVIIVDSQKAHILGEGGSPHPIISDSNGRHEQLTHWWTEALESAFSQAIEQAG